MPRGNRRSLSLGPGFLFWNLLGAAEPTDLVTAWPSTWIPLGYTDDGSKFSYELSTDPIEVAEELDALGQTPTGREIKVSFSSAEVTIDNYKRAMNGGTIVLSGTGVTQIQTFEPPDLGTETNAMLGYESEDHRERWVWRECTQSGSIETERKKGNDKGLIPMEFAVNAPSAGGRPFKIIGNRGLT